MRLTVTSNLDEVEKRLDQLADVFRTVAAARAVNKLRDQARTAGFRKISDVYSIGPRTMDRYTTQTDAKSGDPQASIIVKGKGFPLIDLQPRQTATGVSVNIKGKRVNIKHAFIQTMPNGHVGVFARGKYGARFQFGAGGRHRNRPRKERTELPISELFSFAPPDTLSNPDVVEAMHDRVAEQAAKVLAQELRFAFS